VRCDAPLINHDLHSSISYNQFRNRLNVDTAPMTDCTSSCFHPLTIQRVRAALEDNGERSAACVAARFASLGNPQRLTILRALQVSELCVCDLACVLGLSTAATSQQLRLLREQGWLCSRREGKQVYYRLVDDLGLATLITELNALAVRPHAMANAS